MGLLGYSFVQQSPIDRFHLDKTFNKIGNLLSKTIIVDPINDENEKYRRASLDDYELGDLLGCGCNAAVYEARLRSSSSSFIIPSERHSSESDIEILSRQSSYEDACEKFDNDEEETLKEGN